MGPVGQRVARVEVGEDPAQLVDLLAQRRVAGLRLLLDALQPPLHVVAVGDEQLELEVLEVVRGRRAVRVRVEHDEQRVDLAQRPQQRRPGAGHVLHADRRRRDLARGDDDGELVEPLVGDRRHPDVRLAVALGARLRERGEERGLARPGQTDDADFECHGPTLSAHGAAWVRLWGRRPSSGATRARDAAAT